MHRTLRLSALTALAVLMLGPFASSASGGTTASYIVQVDPAAGAVSQVVQAALAPLGGTVDQTFSDAINGAVVTLPVVAAGILAAVPGITSVEPNGTKSISETQSNPPWGLDRIDQANLPLNTAYAYTRTGDGVDAYIIDTGIRVSHSDFGARATSGMDAIDNDNNADDCNGHGTHVAGTTGGATYGVAKKVRLIAVRVLDCDGSGTDAQVIKGINWVIEHHQNGKSAVANISFGGSASSAVDTAVRNLIKDGITVALAAGNESTDACKSSPARVAEAITVAATDASDAMTSFSNGGTCVDLLAPGAGITSAWNDSNTGTNTISGTSMSAPHVTGAAARYLAAHPGTPPSGVATALINASAKNRITKTERSCQLLVLLCRPATANRLLYLAPSS
ncbi:MAG: S8 family peptidase [Acidimicrobiales bacterium]